MRQKLNCLILPMICLNNNIKYYPEKWPQKSGGFSGFYFCFVVDVGCFSFLSSYEVDSVLRLM